MKTKNKKLLILTALGTSSLALVLGIVGMNGTANILHPNAETCSHSHVEHYDGSIDPTDASGKVEHWACCECHTAWADETRTIVLGNTTSDRSKIDFDSDVYWNVDWGNTSKPIYNPDIGFEFDCKMNNLSEGACTAIETMTPKVNPVIENTTFVSFYLTNNATNSVRVDVHARSWGGDKFSSESLAVNETKLFTVSRDQWNKEVSGANYGIAVLVYNSETQTDGDYLTISLPNIVNKGEVFNHVINSNYTPDWSPLPTTHDLEYGLVSVGNFDGMTKEVQVAHNGLKFSSEIRYSKLMIGIFNPTNTAVNNVQICGQENKEPWRSFVNVVVTLNPGWNEIELSTDLFNYKDIQLLTIYLRDTVLCKANGWKFSQIIGMLVAKTTRLSDLSINSHLTNWESFTEKESTPEFGEVTVCDLSSAETFGAFSIVWNGAPVHPAGEYSCYYFAMFNPTDNTFDNVDFNAAKSDWNTLSTRKFITLAPGWNVISLNRGMFENLDLSMYSINVSATDAPLWANANWKISNFFGVN